MERLEATSLVEESPPAEESATGWAPPRLRKTTQDLLNEFQQSGHEACFEEVVRRYGAMVFNVCYGVTRNRHDAEDAVQAVFLVLAERLRAGDTIHSLGAWLQQVGRRASVDIRRSRTRRRRREIERSGPEITEPVDALDMEGTGRVIREELDRVPVKYRIPLVLHYLGGLGYAETAKELGIKPATLGVRLFRGRKMLGERLARRGLALSAAGLGILVSRVVRRTLSDSVLRSAAKTAVARSLSGASSGGSVAWASATAAGNGLGGLIISTKLKLLIAAGLVFVAAAGAGAAVGHFPELPSYLRLRPRIPTIKASLPSLRVDATQPPTATEPAGARTPAVATTSNVAAAPGGGPRVPVEPLASSGPAAPMAHASFGGGGPRKFVAGDQSPPNAGHAEGFEPIPWINPSAGGKNGSSVASGWSGGGSAPGEASTWRRSHTDPSLNGGTPTQPTAGNSTPGVAGPPDPFAASPVMNSPQYAPVAVANTPVAPPSILANLSANAALANRPGSVASGTLLNPGAAGGTPSSGVALGTTIASAQGATGQPGAPGASSAYSSAGNGAVIMPSGGTPSAGAQPGSSPGTIATGTIAAGATAAGTNVLTTHYTLAAPDAGGTPTPTGGTSASIGGTSTATGGTSASIHSTPTSIAGGGGGPTPGRGGSFGGPTTSAPLGATIGQTGSGSETGAATTDLGKFNGQQGDFPLPSRTPLPSTGLPAGGATPSYPSFVWSPGKGNDTTLSTPGSVRLTYRSGGTAAAPSIGIVATNDPAAPAMPVGQTIVGLWSIKGGPTAGSSADVTVHFDHTLVTRLGVDASKLTVWGYNGTWQQLSGAGIDPTLDLAWGQAPGQTQLISIATPEPASASVAVLASGLLLLRRRRRST